MITVTQPRRYSWLLFDADDTLFNYKKAEETALLNVFAHYQVPFQSSFHEIYTRINHHYWQQFEAGQINLVDLRVNRFRDLLSELKLPVEPITFSKTYLEYLGRDSQLLPGVVDTLTTLAPYYHMAIITNGISTVQRSRLAGSPIQSLFDHIFISEEIGFSKPSGGYFDFVFHKLGNPQKSEVLVIGDSLSSDISGGIQYGLDTCWFNPQQLPNPQKTVPSFEIQNLSELIAICRVK